MYPINTAAIRLLLISLLFFVSFNSFAQHKSKAQLEKEKEENLERIRETQKILEETRSSKQATLGELAAINTQIRARNAVITSIAEELSYLESEISDLEIIITTMETDLETLKKEYSLMIYAAYKSGNYLDKLTFIFASRSFNQLLMRLRYFRHYSQMRKTQLEQIAKVRSSLASERTQLSRKREEKRNLLLAQKIETENLTNVKEQQKKVVKDLSQKEKKLKKDLDDGKKALKKLEKLITDLIAAEREKASRAAAAAGKSRMTPEALELSNNFTGNQGKLPWPVAHGDISKHFGKQAHPVLKNIYVDNLGIDILTLKTEPVRSVFQGKIVAVASVPGLNQVIMIQHGEYYTVYARVKSPVNVKVGQEVKAREVIGEVYTDKNEVSELQFQIWKNNVKLDPEKWIYIK